MKDTFTLAVDSCESRPQIDVRFKNIKHEHIEEAARIASAAFRQVEVTNEETGEIVFSLYVDCDWFNPSRTYGKTIDAINLLCYGED